MSEAQSENQNPPQQDGEIKTPVSSALGGMDVWGPGEVRPRLGRKASEAGERRPSQGSAADFGGNMLEKCPCLPGPELLVCVCVP